MLQRYFVQQDFVKGIKIVGGGGGKAPAKNFWGIPSKFRSRPLKPAPATCIVQYLDYIFKRESVKKKPCTIVYCAIKGDFVMDRHTH